MRHFFRILLLVALFAVLHPYSSSAQTLTYGYDAAGNRIKREIVFSTYNSRKGMKKSSFTESFSDKTIKIYPNPTKGMLKVEIIGWSDVDSGSIILYSSGGANLMSVPIQDASVTLDISNYSPGIYIMNITILDKKTTWKIIKE